MSESELQDGQGPAERDSNGESGDQAVPAPAAELEAEAETAAETELEAEDELEAELEAEEELEAADAVPEPEAVAEAAAEIQAEADGSAAAQADGESADPVGEFKAQLRLRLTRLSRRPRTPRRLGLTTRPSRKPGPIRRPNSADSSGCCPATGTWCTPTPATRTG